MSYLKIYTKAIVMHRERYEDFIGELMLDYDLYGITILNEKIPIVISRVYEDKRAWDLKSRDNKRHLQVKDVFWSALNHYLFDVLLFDPGSQFAKIGDEFYEYHFKSIYFDVGTGMFTSEE